MAEEIELKLALPSSACRALLRHPLLAKAGTLGGRKLTNVYFDTPDLALRRQAIALRTRKQGRRWLQTVKCAGAGSGGLTLRPEWEQPYSGRFDFSAVTDGRVREFLERHKINSQLAPVFETVFARSTWRLAPPAGGSVLLMLDRGWIAAGEAREPICEVELELEDGATAALFDLALALAADLPLKPAILSKAERGFRLRRGEAPAPVKAGPAKVSRGEAPLEAFCSVAADCIAQLQLNEPGAGEADPEFVHQMRVALRRLRSALRTFRPALPADAFDALVPTIRQLARSLGEARDWDVLARDIVAPACAAFPNDARLDTLRETVEQRRGAARTTMRAALNAPEYARFVLAFTALLQQPAPPADAPPLEAFAARRLNRLYKRALALAEAARDLDPGRLHALRIGCKRLRYAAEFFAPLFRARDIKPMLETLTGLQDMLGALNDLAGAGEPLMDCAGDQPGLREAVALVGGWHGPRHEALRAGLPRRIAELLALNRFWRN